MAANVVQFVDQIAAAPNVRLDLNDSTRASGWMLAPDGLDFSPPSYRRVEISTMLANGARIPAGAFDNRVLKLKLTYVGAQTAAAISAALSALAVELLRDENIIRIQVTGAAGPRFLKAYAAPDYTLEMLRLQFAASGSVVLTIPCQPFALGQRVDSITSTSVLQAPATAFFDVTVTGDVETPAFMQVGVESLATFAMGLRRRGTVANLRHYTEAESSVSGFDADTTMGGAADAQFSPSGTNPNFTRTTFASDPLLKKRMRLVLPGGVTTDAHRAELPGTYRVFARVRSSAVRTYQAQIKAGTWTGDLVTFTAANANPFTVDLGLISLPIGGARRSRGYDGLAMLGDSYAVDLWLAKLTAGAVNFDVDYLRLIPADDCMLLGANGMWHDGPNDASYYSSNTLATNPIALEDHTFVGRAPLLQPGITNRLYVMDLGDHAIGSNIAASTLTLSYWPRWLSFA